MVSLSTALIASSVSPTKQTHNTHNAGQARINAGTTVSRSSSQQALGNEQAEPGSSGGQRCTEDAKTRSHSWRKSISGGAIQQSNIKPEDADTLSSRGSLPQGDGNYGALDTPTSNTNNGSTALSTSAIPPPTATAVVRHDWQQRLKDFVISNFLLLGFCVAIIWALAWPVPGKYLASWQALDVRIIQAINNFLVFLVSGLTLRTNDIKNAVSQWQAALWGLTSILLLTPCLGFATRYLPLSPKAFSTGLTIFSAVPTTLGVGVALVGAAKGNQAVALLLTVVSNLLGIVTVPYGLRLLLQGTGQLSVDPLDLLVKLLLTVLLPTILGKVATMFSPRVDAWVKAHKVGLSLFSTSNLVCIIWQTLSSARHVLVRQRFTSILAVIGLAVAQHILYLAANAAAVLAAAPHLWKGSGAPTGAADGDGDTLLGPTEQPTGANTTEDPQDVYGLASGGPAASGAGTPPDVPTAMHRSGVATSADAAGGAGMDAGAVDAGTGTPVDHVAVDVSGAPRACPSFALLPDSFGVKEAIAVVIMASQKSAPVAVTIITYITNDGVQQGLLAIPALCGQICQIFIGSLLVKVLARAVKESSD